MSMVKKKATSSSPECVNCTSTVNADGKKSMLICSRCGLVNYCSRNCQIQHWKSGGHRQFCVTPEERSVQAAVRSDKDNAVVTKVGDNYTCPICMGPLDESITTLPCSHVIHTHCMNDLRSFGTQNVCPSCRAELPFRLEIDHTDDKKCASCGASKNGNSALHDCSRCKSVSYCGRECQLRHWKEGGHKLKCEKNAAKKMTLKELHKNEEFEKELIRLLQVLPPSNKAKAQKHKAKVMQLIAKRANWSVASNVLPMPAGSFTPLSCAASNGRAEFIPPLLEAGADVNLKDRDGRMPLSNAVFQGHVDCISLLLQAGADANERATPGTPPLLLAAGKGHAECVALLLAAGADVNHVTDSGNTSLIRAAFNGHAICISMLLEAGADVNHVSDNGMTSLLMAAENGHAKCISMLLEAGADVHRASEDGNTPLLVAVNKSHAKCISFLLEAGADVHRISKLGCPPLMIAAKNGDTECIAILLEAGADVNHATNTGCTPLAMAAIDGNIKCISLLLKAGARVNHAFDDGWTPLIMVASFGHAECISFLLEAGADVHHTSNNGESPREIAVKSKKGQWQEVVKLLDAHTGGPP